MADSGSLEATTTNQDEPKLDDDLVRKVADRVFQMLLEEARIESERRRLLTNGRRFGQGGR